MDKTFLEELVEYPAIAIQKIGTDESIVKLLTNNPDVDMNSEEADGVFENNIFDYDYVDDTINEASAYICVESDVVKIPNSTVKNMRLYVTVKCHKKFMKIDISKFKGIIGNRRDNLSMQVDRVLNGSDLFGIGQLQLESVRVISAPAGFTARELTYKMPEFNTR